MKKFFYAIAALAIVASCSKVSEVENKVEPNGEVNLVNMTIRTKAPVTKTFIEKTGEKTYQPQWNSTDKLGIFFDSVKAAKEATLENTSSDGAKGEFYGPVSVSNGTYKVYAYYPSDATIAKGTSDSQVVFTVPTLQKPSADNFDKNADIAVSRANNIEISGTDVAIDDMVFGRILSTVKVTVNNNNADVDNSESIQGIVISAQDSGLTGDLQWDFENEEAEIVEGESSVSALFKENPISFGTTFFLLVNPTSITPSTEKPLTITIFTEAHTITKTITALGKDLVFPLGGIAELNIGTSGAAVTEAMVATLVKSPSSLAAGDEVIIAAADYYNVVMSTDQRTNNRGLTTAVLYDEESIYLAQDDIQRFAVEYGTKPGSFAFKGINGEESVADKYIYAASSSSNNLRSQVSKDANASFIVTFDADGVAAMTAQGTNSRNVLKYNDSNNLFSCYSATSTQKDVAIYRYKAGVYVPSLATPANLAADYDSGTVTVSWDAVESADSYTVTLTGKDDKTGITATSTTFTEVNPGTYTITVTAVSNDHSSCLDSVPASIEPTFGTVYDFTTIAELNALITSTTAQDYSGTLTSAIVSYVPDTKNAVIKDASGSILYYLSAGHGLKQGQTFSGELTVTVMLYNGTTREITAWDASFTGEETTVDPVAMTLDQLVGNFSTYQNAYVTVSDLIVTAVNGKNVNVKNGNKTYLVYSNPGNATVSVNDIITAVGTVAQHNSSDQIKVWDANNIIKTGTYTPPTHTVTFTQPSETGCSFTVSVGGSPISSGDSVAEGATVTLNATAGTGYIFSSWTVTGATVSGNTPSATFVMGESNVTIYASFVEGGGGSSTPDDNSANYSGNITLSTTGGTNTSTCSIVISETSYDGIKAGTSKNAGAVKITVPAGTKFLHLHVAGWKGENVTLEVTPAGYSSNISLTSDNGISNNSPFTFVGDPSSSSFYKVIEFTTALASETDLTFTATSGKRFVVWGVTSQE